MTTRSPLEIVAELISSALRREFYSVTAPHSFLLGIVPCSIRRPARQHREKPIRSKAEAVPRLPTGLVAGSARDAQLAGGSGNAFDAVSLMLATVFFRPMVFTYLPSDGARRRDQVGSQC